MIKQRTAAWFEQRKGRLTASIAGAALGISPWMTTQDARDTINGVREFKGNVATDYGTNLEPQAIEEFEMTTGLTVDEAPFIPYGNWSGGSPDGFVSDGAIIEVKCPYGLRNELTLDNVKPISEQLHYYAQVQLCMHFVGAEKCYFATYLPLAGVQIETVLYDEEWIIENMPKLRKFWMSAITEPTAIMRMHVDEYLRKKAEIEVLKAEMSDILESIVEEADGNPCRIGDHKLVFTERKGSISYAKAIKALAPDADLEEYRGSGSSSWGIR